MTSRKRPPPAVPKRPRRAGRGAHRVIFVTGKGGVGKSAVAAATALQLARSGQSVLLVELGDRSFYGRLLGLPVDTDPVAWQPGVVIARWDVESSLRKYLGHYLVFEAAAEKLLNNTVMKALVSAAPSLAELSLLGRLMAPMRYSWYRRDVDVVVVDAYATGQFMAFLRAPRGMAQTVSSGPMHTQSRELTALLSDAAICEYRLVTLAEELPISEACELAVDIHAETGIAPRVFCNRMISLPARLPTLPVSNPAALFVASMAQVAARQRDGLAALEALGGHRAGPVCRLPLLPTLDAGPLLEALADALSEETALHA
jgi:hypothetical protein